MLHFAQAAIALLAGGASVLIVGGFVRETLRDGNRHFHLFPDAHDHSEKPVAKRVETASDAGPFPHPHSENARRDKRGRKRADDDGDFEPKKETKRRGSKKRDRGERRKRASSCPEAAETENV